jgi:lysophospholipase L1-like esterase
MAFSAVAAIAAVSAAAPPQAQPASALPGPALPPDSVAGSVTRPTTAPAIPFEKEIAAFEALNLKLKPAPGGVIFYGSSSIRLWKTLSEDLPGLSCVNRGFGGSTIPDALRYAERVLVPLSPNTVVFYSGDNDLARGRTPQQVISDTREFVTKVRTLLPKTRVVLVSVKPSPSRLRLLAAQREVNKAVADWVTSQNDPNLCHVDVFSAMVDAEGKPRLDLFSTDKLHMNRTGYKVWTGLLLPRIRGASQTATVSAPATPQPAAMP